MTIPKRTVEVSRQTGIHVCSLISYIRTGKMEPPIKDASGVYCWSPEDIARAVAVKRKYGRRPYRYAGLAGVTQ